MSDTLTQTLSRNSTQSISKDSTQSFSRDSARGVRRGGSAGVGGKGGGGLPGVSRGFQGLPSCVSFCIWDVLGRLGGSWGRLGASLGRSWGVLGRTWQLGVNLARSGVDFNRFLVAFGTEIGAETASTKSLFQVAFTSCFRLFFQSISHDFRSSFVLTNIAGTLCFTIQNAMSACSPLAASTTLSTEICARIAGGFW